MGKVISVVSGKGGTGKTTVSSNLAVCLAKLGKKTLAIDCDFKMRNLDQHLGLSDGGVFDFFDVLTERCKALDAIFPHPLPGLSFIPASNSRSFAEENAGAGLEKTISELKAAFDFILLDCPSGAEFPVPEIGRLSDEVAVVVLPDRASIRNAERVVDALSRAGCENFSLVVNRVDPRLMKRGYCENVDSVMDALGLPLLGVVYEEPGAILYLSKGEPLSIEECTAASLCFRNIARRLLGERVPVFLI